MFPFIYHKHNNFCPGYEELLHLLYEFGLKSPEIMLLSIAISTRGRRYFYPGSLQKKK
jgi:hypothetical protein